MRPLSKVKQDILNATQKKVIIYDEYAAPACLTVRLFNLLDIICRLYDSHPLGKCLILDEDNRDTHIAIVNKYRISGHQLESYEFKAILPFVQNTVELPYRKEKLVIGYAVNNETWLGAF